MWGAGEAEKGKEILQICRLINRAILEVPVAVFCNVIMLCFSEGGAGWSGRVGVVHPSAVRHNQH